MAWRSGPIRSSARRRERGVALICQSGTIALTLLFNERSLPIGYLFTVGNQSRLAVEDLIEILCDDPRVTAFGLYLEGIKDPARFARATARARAARKPIAVVKSGRTAAAARTAHSHTGALAGADEVFESFCRQAGHRPLRHLATLCETLKIFHAAARCAAAGADHGCVGRRHGDDRRCCAAPGARVSAAAARVRRALMAILGMRVTIANPFDFHTHVWFDRPRCARMFCVARRAGYDLVGFMIDCPPPAEADAAAYLNAIEEFAQALPGAASRGAVICSLPESLPAATREQCLAAGIVPLQGQRAALEAVDLAGAVGLAWAPARRRAAAPATHPRQLAQPRGARRQGGARRPWRARAALERGAAAGCGGGR